MPVNFDTELPNEEDLQFIAQGRVYQMRLAPPSVLADIEDEDDDNLTAEEATSRLVTRVGLFLTDEDRAEWVKANEEALLPYRQVRAIWDWSWEVQTGRPTAQVPRSDDGRGSTGATSEVAAARSARAAARSRPRGRR